MMFDIDWGSVMFGAGGGVIITVIVMICVAWDEWMYYRKQRSGKDE